MAFDDLAAAVNSIGADAAASLNTSKLNVKNLGASLSNAEFSAGVRFVSFHISVFCACTNDIEKNKIKEQIMYFILKFLTIRTVVLTKI